MDKTRVMIFNKTGRHMRRNFYLGDEKVKTTREYKYLGFKFTPSSEITSGLSDLKDRAMKAFYKIKRKMGPSFQTFPLLTLKLFDTLIKPILLYGSDFWGILKLPKNNPFEILHLQCCKQVLGVQKQTTNIGVLLELGQIPLHHYAVKNGLKNWVRLTTQQNGNEITLKSHEFARENNLKSIACVQDTLSRIGLMEDFITKNKKHTHINAWQRLNDIFHQLAFTEIKKENSKLRTYGLLKTNIGFENYLHADINLRDRIALTKLRLSNHELMIEKGRHTKIDKNKRFCPFCPKIIETELHFLLHCNTFSHLRMVVFEKTMKENPNFIFLQDTEKFILLLTKQNLINHTANFLKKGFEYRSFLLGKYKYPV